jgi:serine phosphatase RsbU (regulator of sigma subunit)
VYLTGNTAQLGNWNPAAIAMTKESDSVWSVTLPIKEGENIHFKVTAGSWWTEALDKDEARYNEFALNVKSDTTVRVAVYDWLNRMINGRPVYSAKRFHPNRGPATLDDLWRYHPGDDTTWRSPAYNDSGWATTNPYIRWTQPSDPRWDGMGWFRFHMYVDSSLWNKTVAIRISQLGASQIYYNGRLLYSFGKIGGSASTTEPNAMVWWQQFQFDPHYDQLIAVRYANYDWKSILSTGYFPGFLIRLGDLNTTLQDAASVREQAVRQTIFTLIPLTLFFLHFFLYGFYRKQRQNLFYAICMLGFAGLTYFNYERNVIVNVETIVLFTKLSTFSVAVAIFFGLLTNYESIYETLPRRTWVFFGVFCLVSLAVLTGFLIKLVGTLNYIFFGLTFADIVYGAVAKKRKQLHGGWLLMAGFAILAIFVVLQILLDYSVVLSVLGSNQVYVYGMMGLAVSMSVFLSYNFSRINRDLEVQLDNVKLLSEKAIEQERVAHKLDLERKVIEVENDRKNKELESARELQLSLLPKSVPKLKGLEIAAFMKTATEVGGDYYDFIPCDNGSLLVALGDATGHGLKAGNMVTATKGLLNILSETEKVEDILISANRAIKQMNLHMLTMCLAIARIKGTTLKYSSAGMPPLLVYRAQSRECEQYVLKAMPLGAVARFPYESIRVDLFPSDVVLMASDGLIEFFDEGRETFGIQNIVASLKRHAEKPAQEIMDGLHQDVRRWGGDSTLVDDLTMIVMKMTSQQDAVENIAD